MGVNSFKDIGQIYKPQESGYRQVRRGEIYYVEKAGYTGSEQMGGRPALIVGNDIGNEKSPVVLAVYLTTNPKPHMPTHVVVACKEPSTALCEQVFTVDKSRLGDYIRTASEDEMQKIDKALAVSLSLEIPGDHLADCADDDKLLSDAISRVREIAGAVDQVRCIDQTIERVQNSGTLGFMGGQVTILDGIIPEESVARIRKTALTEISNERESVRRGLERLLAQEQKAPEENLDGPLMRDVVSVPKNPKKPTKKKIDDTAAMKMLSEGKTQKEMCERFGVTPGTMSVWVKNHKPHKPVEERVKRTQCETCKYHTAEAGKMVCRYEKITGKKRGCEVDECRKWREV